MITRRNFLGAAGVAPLLRPFASTAFAAGTTPTRIIFVYSPNGVVASNFFPDTADLTEKPILKPLAPHAKEMTLIRGMGYTGYNTPHSMGTTKALTNRDVFGAGNTPAAARGVMDQPSLDHLLSKSVGAANFRPALRVGGHWGNNRGYLMFGDGGQVLAPINKPEEVFDFAFGGATGAVTPAPGATMPSAAELARAQALRDAKKSVLDVVRGDIKTLQTRLPAGQKHKMDSALTAISELEKGIGAGAPAGGGAAPVMAAPVQCADKAAVQQAVTAVTDEKQKQARVIANAFACDVTRIAVWKLVASADGGTPFGGYHDTSHLTGDPAADAKLTEIEAWQAEQVSYLAIQLKAVKDPLGTGSVFDSSIIYWFNECGHGNHDPNNLPIVLLGSGGGKMEMNRQIKIDDATKKYGNILVSLAHAMGDTSIKVIGDLNACNGPLPGLLKPGISPV